MKIKILFCIGLLGGMFASCTDILDVRNTNVINPDIWDSEKSAMLFVNNLYKGIPTTHNITDNSTPFGLHGNYCDETVGSNTFVNGELSYNSIGVFSDSYYVNIRNINIAIENMQSSSLTGDSRNRVLGQLYFLRAWSYWNLVLIYGGIPYVTESVDILTGDASSLDPVRNKTSECIEYLCDDLDHAIVALPAKVTDYLDGATSYARVTRSAAAALKGRILLFYASPQFNLSNDLSRWENAYQANLAARDTAAKDGKALISKFDQIFLKESTENTEALFVKAYDATVSITHGWENSVRPNIAGDGGGGTGSNPTWDLVQAFPMNTGLAISDVNSNYDSKLYFKNRDPRFYATIGYNGCSWSMSGLSEVRVWSYTGCYANVTTSNLSKTGFYCRKATNPLTAANLAYQCATDWIEIRYAEVLLNLAECANETGRQSEAISLIGQLRARAGILAGDGLYGLQASYSNSVDLTEIIMKERAVEFAFENKRFWDMRRRRMFNNDLGTTPMLNGRKRQYVVTGVVYPAGVVLPSAKTKYLETLLAKRSSIVLETEYSNYFTTTITNNTGDTNYPIAIPAYYDFFGIPKNIIDRSSAIKQTQGWGDGTNEFNPYE